MSYMSVRLLAAASFIMFGVACSDGPTPDSSESSAAASESSVSATEEPVEGVFVARIEDEEFAEFPYLPDDFGGRWTLTVSEEDYVLEGPIFRVTEQILQAADGTWAIDATPAPTGAFNCFDDDGERLTGEGQASAVYEVALQGDELTLASLEEPCALRTVFLERTWSLKSP